MSRIALVGGHGKIALKLAKILTENGHEVSSLIRNPDQTADIEKTGATAVVADVEAQTTQEIAGSVTGHDAVVFAAGAGGGDTDRTYAVDRDAAIRSIDAASASGVPRFVLVSYFGAGPDHGVSPDDSFYAYAEAKAEADQHLKNSDLSWTIVAPSGLTDDAGTGSITTKEQGATGASVSRDDVAAVIATVLDTPSTAGRMIEFDQGETPIADALS
ncbi:SDR family oxidoreductase [Rhodococcus sp. BP-349]|uniref:SDR family oxidoreductase n=1 Tax=unclassified Rhodococcus (in: high G+C Gram-positive bacteria) TaxID=192944 RepID=UPI001C9AE89E|nr:MULTISPECIES: SDR family oxidoreductase [unclassified Rhodococcus (in: high G+C Gram-positive bacteria)]MBY6539939.1 SDR family oxidoreductase [Rhodococcus sp. BP-363]MBY6543733.1 SDR family oxidoreductase [Rhodococcus sp. BP-369]MBY6562963.1 SDR family oxidoreductase [Rhodococcus sp. BP-370]MBY6577255.1 SDR family oxidoreductase [Rhodococcus sp. BP-364]MBY6586556.1 SDR family oxidoreductase [Rhodococcus sp. BP-358]